MSATSGTYEQFLESTLARHWDSPSASRKSFLALLLATPEAWQVAWNDLSKEGLTKPLVASAISVATLTAALRLISTGPLGMVLTGLSVGTLAAIYRDAPEEILRRTEQARALVERYRDEYGELAKERDRRNMREAQWELMMNSLSMRFLAELSDSGAYDPAAMGGLAEHVGIPSMVPPRTRGT